MTPQPAGLKVRDALQWGFSAILAVTFVASTVGLLTRSTFTIPRVVEVSSSPHDAALATSLTFEPVVLVVLALVVGAALWSVGRIRRTAKGSDDLTTD
jgi:hypothetical protein